MESGIYKITNTKTNKFYVGSAKNIKKREYAHFNALKKNKHDNSLLQNAFNKYGISNFNFSILEYCNVINLIEREQFYLDLLQPFNKNIGYNLCPTANSTLGFSHSIESRRKLSLAKKGLKLRLGAKLTQETKDKISKANKGKSHKQSDNTKEKISRGNKGKKRTEEQKENYSILKLKYYENKPKKIKKISENKNRGEINGNSKLTKNIVLAIRNDFENQKLNHKELMLKYQLNYGLIYKIVKKLRWNWL